MHDDVAVLLAHDLEAGFECLVRRHQDLVFGVALRATGSRDDAEEVAQEAFVRAYRALRGYPPERVAQLHPRGWLARIALNVSRNRARKHEVRHAPLDRDVEDDRAEPVDGPERLWERKESNEMWGRLLAGLPPQYRVAVELRHVEGLSYPEVAEALGRPTGTVKAHVHRGVRLLRAAYESEQRRVEQVA